MNIAAIIQDKQQGRGMDSVERIFSYPFWHDDRYKPRRKDNIMAYINGIELDYVDLLSALLSDVQQDDRLDEDTSLDAEALLVDLHEKLSPYCEE